MKQRHVTDFHKLTTWLLVLSMMVYYDNYTSAAWTYLAIHGSYGLMWVIKSNAFPDSRFEKVVSFGEAVMAFLLLTLYWVAPWMLLSGGAEAKGWLLCLSVSMFGFGIFFAYGSDAQKYFVLQARRGLITDGFFARTRNPNYLGEMLIYGSFATLSMHWIPWLSNLFFWSTTFIPNMLRKDKSMSRYPEWENYVGRTGMLFPRLFVSTAGSKEK